MSNLEVDYCEHLCEVFIHKYDITDLDSDSVERLLVSFDERVSVDSQVPVYMLGGRANDGIAWRDFKTTCADARSGGLSRQSVGSATIRTRYW